MSAPGSLYIERAYGPPRGLASNSGFEAEDSARAHRLAQNALNSRHAEMIRAARAFAEELWLQDKTRHPETEAVFVDRFVSDLEMAAADVAKAGVLPKDGVWP